MSVLRHKTQLKGAPAVKPLAISWSEWYWRTRLTGQQAGRSSAKIESKLFPRHRCSTDFLQTVQLARSTIHRPCSTNTCAHQVASQYGQRARSTTSEMLSLDPSTSQSLHPFHSRRIQQRLGQQHNLQGRPSFIRSCLMYHLDYIFIAVVSHVCVCRVLLHAQSATRRHPRTVELFACAQIDYLYIYKGGKVNRTRCLEIKKLPK